MFSTREIKDLIHTFPIRGGDVSNPVVADGLIPSESKDGFVQVQTLQEALKRAIEEGKNPTAASNLLPLNDGKKKQLIKISF